MTETIPHYDRIRATVVLLENLPREREKGRLPGDLTDFYFGDWRCGTAACAGGYMAAHVVFRRHGLRASRHGMPVYGDLPGRMALAAFLGIDVSTANRWFVSGPEDKFYSSVTAQDIADMIRAWLADHGELGRLA